MFKFKDFDYLTDGEIDLRIVDKLPADDIKGYVPVYEYRITLHGFMEPIGSICIRIGYNENIKYGGNIGYEIAAGHRGNHYASRACKLVKQVGAAHSMDKLIITCNPDNYPSRKTCERIGAVLKDIIDLPSYNEQYQIGDRQKCIYEWVVK